MAKQSIESMYDIMFKMREKIEDLLQDAQELTTAASTYGGEISRVLNEQLTKYFAPSVKKLLDDENTPGSIVGLVNFMDSVPLSYTRVNPSIEEMAPVTPDNPQFDMPATLNNDLDSIPQNASFNTGISEENLNQADVEPVITNIPQENNIEGNIGENMVESSKYFVVRTSEVGSSLGDIANLEEEIVAEFNNETDAVVRAEALNETILPEEKDLLGTKYSVVEKKTEEE